MQKGPFVLHPPFPQARTDYGGYIKRIIAQIKELPDKASRNSAAQYIIRWMAQIQGISPQKLMENPAIQKRIWENFLALAGSDIDIDIPFSISLEPEAPMVPKLSPIAVPSSKTFGSIWPEFEKQLQNYPPEERKTIALSLIHFLRQTLGLSMQEILQHLQEVWDITLSSELPPSHTSQKTPSTPSHPPKKRFTHGRFSGRRR